AVFTIGRAVPLLCRFSDAGVTDYPRGLAAGVRDRQDAGRNRRDGAARGNLERPKGPTVTGSTMTARPAGPSVGYYGATDRFGDSPRHARFPPPYGGLHGTTLRSQVRVDQVDRCLRNLVCRHAEGRSFCP